MQRQKVCHVSRATCPTASPSLQRRSKRGAATAPSPQKSKLQKTGRASQIAAEKPPKKPQNCPKPSSQSRKRRLEARHKTDFSSATAILRHAIFGQFILQPKGGCRLTDGSKCGRGKHFPTELLISHIFLLPLQAIGKLPVKGVLPCLRRLRLCKLPVKGVLPCLRRLRLYPLT